MEIDLSGQKSIFYAFIEAGKAPIVFLAK